MRLLNTTTFELKDFLGVQILEYAILSHTWGEEEIIFPDLLAQANDDSWKTKKSFKKVLGFCSLAQENGYEWCWIDTCCIDKSSSAELSEAINSMFRWYAESHVCFVYLSDVQVDHSCPEQLAEFEWSRWHKRGWTLQELLAPERVEFYDGDWNQIGTRFSLAERISKITGIRAEVLVTNFDVESSKDKYCVAEKMSWAANRNTARVEDLAYCLLGLFDINMPLLYGEGIRAFERLQFQILAETEDMTLFAWKGADLNPSLLSYHLLAGLPLDFRESSDGFDSYAYRSLDARSWDMLWKDLKVADGDSLRYQSEKFISEQPVKRLGTAILSAAIPSVRKTTCDHLILARIKGSPVSTDPEYLCLPLYMRQDSAVYEKGGLPRRIGFKKRSLEVRFQRVSILLKPKRHLGSATFGIRPVAVILSLQGRESSPKQMFLHDGYKYDSISILVLNSTGAETLILYGWYNAQNGYTPGTPWALIANSWEELHIGGPAHNLLYTGRASLGNFAQLALGNGTHMYCTLKPRLREWGLCHTKPKLEGGPQDWTNWRGGFFSLDVQIKSTKGGLEGLGYLCWKEFSSFTEFGDYIDNSRPSPRDVLLAEAPQSGGRVKTIKA